MSNALRENRELTHIELQGVRPNILSKHPDNCIVTSKYTFLNFLPKNIMHQFLNPSKLWFLLITVIEVQGLSDVTYQYGTLIPLLILLFLQITRDALKDYHCHKADYEINFRTYPIWDGSKFIVKFCKDILVGDIILLLDSDIVPADVVLLSVGNEEHNCYVDSLEIMGERSLKIKNPVREIQNIIDTIELDTASSFLSHLDDDLFVSLPNRSFKHFLGKVKLSISPKSTEISLRNVLLRDMKIVNTPWLFAICIYTGGDSKIWSNNLSKAKKVSQLTKKLEKWLLWSFLLIFAISVINTIISRFSPVGNYSWYEVFLGNILLFNHMIPISLALVMEFTTVFLSYLVNRRDSNIKLINADLCSNIGMIEYIITDKTGTLTQNKLKVALCVVDDKLYIQNPEAFVADSYERQSSEEHFNEANRILSNYLGDIFSFSDLQTEVLNRPETSKYMHFFYCIALCNLAFPQDNEYIALSEDDKVLAKTAEVFGFKVKARDEETCLIEIFGEDVIFYVLGTQAFSSAHKKSRIVVKRAGASEVYMYLKGDKIAMESDFENNHSTADIDQVIVEYRSLYLGYKLLTRREVKQFVFEYSNAKLSLVNKEGRVESVFEIFDKDADFLGIVGLEDKVTEDTRQAIQTLKNAGIKFWVLSGDSEDSTMTAAFASGIVSKENKVLRLADLTSELDCLNYLETYTKEFIFPSYSPMRGSIDMEGRIVGVKSQADVSISNSPVLLQEDFGFRAAARKVTGVVRRAKRRSSVHPVISKLSIFKHLTSLQGEFDPKEMNFVMSIDSRALEYCMETSIHLKYLIFLLFTAKAVCFHSLLPDQKIKIVKLIKCNFRFNPLVLAIGDSISDVGMIQQAHVGVGIEGTAAANNADVTIKKFGDLQSLLLIHGHKQYIQTSKLILLSLYAVVLLEFQLAFYNIISGWNGSAVLDKNFLLVYKLIISILPILGLCLLDKDNSSTKITPQAYKVGIFNRLLSIKNLFLFILTALFQSVSTFVFSLLFFSISTEQGKGENALLIDICIFLVLSSTLFLSIVVETYFISLKTITIYIVSVALQIVIILPLGYSEEELMGYPQMLVLFKSCWIFVIPTAAFNVAITYCFKALRFNFYPDILEKVRSDTPNSSLESETRLKQYRNEINNVFRESAEFNQKKSYNESKLSGKLLRFTSKYLERNYQDDKVTENMKSFFVLLTLAAVLIFIYSMVIIGKNYDYTEVVVYLSIFSIVFLLAAFMPFLGSFHEHTSIYLIVYLITIQVFFLVLQLHYQVYSLSMSIIFPVIGLVGFSNYWLYMSITQIICTVLVTVNASFYFRSIYTDQSQIIFSTFYYAIIYLALCSISSIIAYHIDKSKRIEFLLVQKVQLEIQKSKSVLNYLLPAFVRKRVKDGVRFISENQGIVTVIFCDICNFESILNNYSTNELTILLDEVFARFDQICMLSGCTKIETVGKTYMACAGLKESEAELDIYYSSVPHARRCIEMALAMLRNTEPILLKNGESLSFHIGINSGVVIAGVVGYHKPQFSLVGDTVNTTSRMASLCPRPNTIQISVSTFELIGDKIGLILTPSSVNAKGKGDLPTYIVSTPEQNFDVSALTSKYGMSHSQSVSEMFSFKSAGARSNYKVKKVTLSKFSNQHADHDRRRSSLISLLESEVTVDNEFIRRETERIEKVKWFSLSCIETAKEKQFRLDASETTYPIVLLAILVRIVCNVLVLIVLTVNIIITKDFEKLYDEIRLIIEIVVVGVLAMNLNKYFRKPWFSWLIGMIYFIGAIVLLGSSGVSRELQFLDYILHVVQTAHCSQLFVKNFIGIGFLYFISYIIFALALHFENFSTHITSLIFCFIVILYSIYNRESNLRYYSTVTVAAEKELKKTEELLTQMMPKHVFEILKEQNSVTESISNVSILYADIVGFTQWSSEKSPEEVVNMLSKLFTSFDYKCVEHKVYKVHTIGDCYVAMGYRESGSRVYTQECYNMAMFALDLVKTIQEVNEEESINLNMRIGMHTGNIIGGITGTNIVRYDIYGIDVLIANKMESNGKSGHVKISETTMKLLKDNYPQTFVFTLDEQGLLEIDNRKIKTFYLSINPECSPRSNNF